MVASGDRFSVIHLSNLYHSRSKPNIDQVQHGPLEADGRYQMRHQVAVDLYSQLGSKNSTYRAEGGG